MTSELAGASYDIRREMRLGRYEVYRYFFFLRPAAQNLRACTHRMYGRKNTEHLVFTAALTCRTCDL